MRRISGIHNLSNDIAVIISFESGATSPLKNEQTKKKNTRISCRLILKFLTNKIFAPIPFTQFQNMKGSAPLHFNAQKYTKLIDKNVYEIFVAF